MARIFLVDVSDIISNKKNKYSIAKQESYVSNLAYIIDSFRI